jgi:DNA-binding MarR family transcriptional regulator
MSSQLLRDQQNVAIDAWVRFIRSHAATRRAVSADLISEHGLTVNDYECLLLLSRAEDGHMRRVDLAEELQLTPSGVTRLLDGLEEQGLVAKDTCSSDARVTYAVITDTGMAKLRESSNSHLGAIRRVFEDRFTGEELATLAELLGRLPGGGRGGDAESCSPPGD